MTRVHGLTVLSIAPTRTYIRKIDPIIAQWLAAPVVKVAKASKGRTK